MYPESFLLLEDTGIWDNKQNILPLLEIPQRSKDN